jgi:hypothetical protein
LQVRGFGFEPNETVSLIFVDLGAGVTQWSNALANAAGVFKAMVTIPNNTTQGLQQVNAMGRTSGEIATKTFTVT